jgi:hypothetical protein
MVRRANENGAPSAGVTGSFVAELAAKAIKITPDDQIQAGALSDLIMFQYAEQSARLRAEQVGGDKKMLYAAFLPWVNARAAEAYQTVTGESVLLPATPTPEYSQIASAVYQKKSPL